MVAPIHDIKLAIYKDIHRERANTSVFGLYLTKIAISLLFFSLLFQEKWIWVYIFLRLFVCVVVYLSAMMVYWLSQIEREGGLIWCGGRWTDFGFLVLIWGQ